MAQLCVALDYDNIDEALACVKLLAGKVKWFKVGMELYNLAGPDIIGSIKELGAEIFLDLKLHDIPQTVERTAKVLAKLGVGMFNVHASGGSAMLKAAKAGSVAGATEAGLPEPLLIGVTVLTSLDQVALQELGLETTPAQQVLRLARLCKKQNLAGVVCSPLEAETLKGELGADFVLVTPGIRPLESRVGDQRRIATPQNAVRWGADYLIVGRPITRAKDPAASAVKILAEMEEQA